MTILKIIFVVVLCIPVAWIAIRLTGNLSEEVVTITETENEAKKEAAKAKARAASDHYNARFRNRR